MLWGGRHEGSLEHNTISYRVIYVDIDCARTKRGGTYIRTYGLSDQGTRPLEFHMRYGSNKSINENSRERLRPPGQQNNDKYWSDDLT